MRISGKHSPPRSGGEVPQTKVKLAAKDDGEGEE